MTLKPLARLVIAAVLAWSCAWAAAAEPALWRVRGPAGGEVVLLGSIHVLTPDLDWRSPAIDEALATADAVWFETPFDMASRLEGAIVAQSRGLAPKGRTLSSYLSAPERALLARAAARLDLPMSALEPLAPWYAEVLLTLADLQSHGGRPDLGVEAQIAMGIPAHARRDAFETAAEQIALFADRTPRQQARTLVLSLKEMEEKPEGFLRLQRAWADGDLRHIESEALTPMRVREPELYRRLVVARNRAWIGAIEGLLKTPEKAFIVVGVGHLIGPDSVPAMLRKKGFAVEGP
jgi:uncharacterized protein YbaP (TraB family)